MHNTIKTHLRLGHSIRSIAKLLGLSRNTVRSIARQLEVGQSIPLTVTRKKLLSEYESEVVTMMNNGKLSVLIHDYLVSKYGLTVNYTIVFTCIIFAKKQFRCFHFFSFWVPCKHTNPNMAFISS